MNNESSKAFDPSYQPTQSWEDLAAQNPGNPGIKMMADRERKLSSHRPEAVPKPK
jgi:hypothetical protein